MWYLVWMAGVFIVVKSIIGHMAKFESKANDSERNN